MAIMVRSTTDRHDFNTHLKYVSLIARLSEGLTATCADAASIARKDLAFIKDKSRLITMTRKSLKDELEIVQLDAEFSTAAVLWLPIKSYYLAYHLLCVVDFILTADHAVLRAGHADCINRFTKMLVDGSLQFNQSLFNQVFDKSILNFKTKSGAVLSSRMPDDVLYKLAMKKMAIEKIETFKAMNGITEVRSKKDKDRVERFKDRLNVSVFDFFHQMRLRMNYRDFDFVDGIHSRYTRSYFEQYYAASSRFYTCFGNLANRLVAGITGAAF